MAVTFLSHRVKLCMQQKNNIAKFEARRAELEKAAAELLKAAQVRQQALAQVAAVTISAKAGEEGKLFGSIGTRDIADAITHAGVEVQKSEIHLPMGALRQVGEYEIEVELHSDLSVMVKLHVVAEG